MTRRESNALLRPLSQSAIPPGCVQCMSLKCYVARVDIHGAGAAMRAAARAQAASLREQVPVQDGGGDAQQQRRQPRAPRAAQTHCLSHTY